MKKILLLAFALLLIPFAYALQDCQKEQNIMEIPCIVSSSYKPTSCNAAIMIFNESGVNIFNTTWQDGTPFCQFQWNFTGKQTYYYNSSIENGTITVMVDNMQIGILIGLGIIIAIFMFLAFRLDDSHFLLRLLLIFESVGLMILIPSVFVVNDLSVIFYKAVMTTVVIFFIYVGIYFFWWLWNKMNNTVRQ